MKTGKVLLLGGELTLIAAYLMNMDIKRSDSIKGLRADLDRTMKVVEKKDEKIKQMEQKIKEMEAWKMEMVAMKLSLVNLVGDGEKEGKVQALEGDCGRNAFRLKDLEEGSGKNDMKIKDFEEELAKKEDRLWRLEDSIKDTSKEGIGKEMAEVKKKVEKFASVEVAVTEALEKQKNESQMSNFHTEMPMVAHNLIFRNFPQDERETKASLKIQVQEVFQSMGIGARINVKEAIRFKKKAPEGSESSWAEEMSRKPGLVLVKLANSEMKKIIFGNIRKLKETPFHRISINNQIPKCVVPQVTALEIRARKIRVDSGFKTKTKIDLNNGNPKIQIKGENDAKFKDI